MKAIPLGFKTTHVPQAGECPDCLERVDAASSGGGHAPKAGDFSVCVFCGCILRFTEKMELRRASEDDLADPKLTAPARDMLLQYQKSFREARAARQTGGPQIQAIVIPKHKL